MLKLTIENFEETVKNNSKVLIDFYADWCGPCKALSPIIEELDSELTDAAICKVNVDESPELAGAFEVQYIPMVVIIKDGKITHSSSGVKTKEQLIELLK
jgi:thioredoxin 1